MTFPADQPPHHEPLTGLKIKYVQQEPNYWAFEYVFPRTVMSDNTQVFMYLPPEEQCVYRLRSATRTYDNEAEHKTFRANSYMARSSPYRSTIVITSIPTDPNWVLVLYRVHIWFHAVPEAGWRYSGQEILDGRFRFDQSKVRANLHYAKRLAHLYEYFCQHVYGQVLKFDLQTFAVVAYYNFLLCLGRVMGLPRMHAFRAITTARVGEMAQRSVKSVYNEYLPLHTMETIFTTLRTDPNSDRILQTAVADFKTLSHANPSPESWMLDLYYNY